MALETFAYPYPGKSTSFLEGLSLSEKMFIACVLPGVLLVFANFLFFVMAFITLDFPELDLPQKATSCPSSSGRFSYDGKLPTKAELVNKSL